MLSTTDLVMLPSVINSAGRRCCRTIGRPREMGSNLVRLAVFCFFFFALLIVFYLLVVESNFGGKTTTFYVSGKREETLGQIDALETNVRKALMKIEELSCKIHGIGTRGGFCLSADKLDVGGNWLWDLKLAQEIEDRLQNQVLGDFGAGLGWYGRYFLRMKNRFFHTAKEIEEKFYLNNSKIQDSLRKPQKISNWKGYDGAVFVSEITGGLVEYLDLSEPFDLREKFDWILSLEVGEHIPIEFEQIFINNLVNHACKGIILSWALPDQGGHHHVNNRPRDYIVAEMKRRGFKSNDEWAEVLKTVSELDWLKRTIMVFQRTQPWTDPKCPEYDKSNTV